MMTRKLPITDHRSIRMILEPDDFALGPDSESPPSDLIRPEVWDSFMTLPDDVAIRTSNHNGMLLADLNRLSNKWIEAVGDPFSMDSLFGCMLEAHSCFEAAVFDMLHGFYRSSISNLRAVIELLMMGVVGNLNPEESCYKKWAEGNGSTKFTACRDRLKHILRDHKAVELFSNAAFPTLLYNDLCNFNHARRGSADGDLWQSNGPIYNPDIFCLTNKLILTTYAVSYLLVKLGRPEFTISAECQFLFEDDVTYHDDKIQSTYSMLYLGTNW